MKVFLKFFSVALVCMLMFQLVGVNVVGATGVVSEDSEFKYNKVFTEFNGVIPETTDDSVEPQGIGTILIFVLAGAAGYLIGEVTGATIEYYSGKSPGEWTKLGLARIESEIRAFAKRYNLGSITVNNDTGSVTWSCNQYPCPIPASEPGMFNE